MCHHPVVRQEVHVVPPNLKKKKYEQGFEKPFIVPITACISVTL